ncbi:MULTISPECIES: N-acetylneuraminate synthase family protein [unclassified Desulfovibrio]|uniref:N-acetylneuraminate synthase family protein n=1 Tax=unclassified Desulfovibrio TaxID=2593640 RepID=UPI002FDAA9EF
MSVFIIAEIGINHNGDIEIAKKLIDMAKGAGCNAVKFQKRDIDVVYTKEFLDSLRESPWGTTQRDQKAGLEFGKAEFDVIDAYCKERDIEWFASAWDENSLEFLDQYDCKYSKVASAMTVSERFLKAVASRKKHTFISTAMSTMDDIGKAVSIFREAGCPFELMHCVGTYPMKVENANLRCIETLRNAFNCNVGYSGHETGLAVSVGAVMLGITSLERHITLDRSMYGSDQAASVEGAGLHQLCRYTRILEVAMGDGNKRILPEEAKVAEKLRAHLKVD